MRELIRARSIITGVVLAAVLHADWHLARPQHHHGFTLNPGFNLAYHWAITALVFGIVGWFISQRWTRERWRVATTALVIGVVLAQIILPVLQALAFEHRLAYAVEPGRWAAFFQALVACVPIYFLAVWLGARESPPAEPRAP